MCISAFYTVLYSIYINYFIYFVLNTIYQTETTISFKEQL